MCIALHTERGYFILFCFNWMHYLNSNSDKSHGLWGNPTSSCNKIWVVLSMAVKGGITIVQALYLFQFQWESNSEHQQSVG